jgi:hypothetical protein
MLGFRSKSRANVPPMVGSQPQYSERRRSNRVEMEVRVVATTEDGKQIFGYTRDLSREGTRVMLRGDLMVGEVVKLKFRTSPSHEEVTMDAVVRTAICERYGFEFIDVDTAHHDESIVSMCKQMTMAEYAN